MSLINDALKRAQQIETHQLPKGPMLRPVEPEPLPEKRIKFALPAGLALVALVAAFLVWKLAYSSPGSNEVAPIKEVRAIAPQPAVVAQPEPVLVETPVPERAEAVQETAPVAPVSPDIAARPEPATAVPAQSPQPVEPQQPAPRANPAAAHDFKLQGVVLSKRPSAMISGLIVYQGDVLSGFKIIKIGDNRVELASESETIVLTLR